MNGLRLLLFLLWLLCSYASATKYNSEEFITANYQATVQNALNITDVLNDLSQNNIVDSLNPEDLSLLMQADLSFNKGDFAQAGVYYAQLAQKYHDPYIIYKAIIAYEHFTTTDQQIKQLNALISLLIRTSPTSNIAKLFAIAQALNDNNLNLAQAHLAYLLKNNPSYARAILLFLCSEIGGINLRPVTVAQYQSLDTFASYILANYSNYPETHLLAIIIFSLTNPYNQSANSGSTYKKSLQQQIEFVNKNYPIWKVPFYWSVSILLRNNDKYALDLLEGLLATEKENNQLLQNMYIATHISFNQLTKANDYLEAQLAMESQSAQQHGDLSKNSTLLNLGLLNMRLHNYNNALNYLTQIHLDNLALATVVDLLIATTYDYLNNIPLAIAYYKRVEVTDVSLRRLINFMMLNDYISLKNYKATDKLLNYIANENHLDARNTLVLKASYYIGVNCFNLAYDLLKQNYVKYPNDKELLFAYAIATSYLRKTQQAIILYKKYIDLAPDDAMGYNDLAFTILEQTKNYKQAEWYVKKAFNMMPLNPSIQDTMGYLYYKQGNYSTAYVYTKVAYDASADYQIAQHLRAIYMAMHEPALANSVSLVVPSAITSNLKQQFLNKVIEVAMYVQYGLAIAL